MEVSQHRQAAIQSCSHEALVTDPPVKLWVRSRRRPNFPTSNVVGRAKFIWHPGYPAPDMMLVPADGELYAGTSVDFMGANAAIFRTTIQGSSQHYIRTEAYDHNWRNEPEFIASFSIPDTHSPDDDKVYFFFKDKAVEAGQWDKRVYSRVARVCKTDPQPGSLVHAQRSVFRGSAVCVYSMASIRAAFNGPFAHKEGPDYRWVEFKGHIPYPRPGACPSETYDALHKSTKDFPDEVVSFMRQHQLMWEPVPPLGGRPIITRVNAPCMFKRVVVDRVEAEDGPYDVLHLGTDDGKVVKVVSVITDSWDPEEIILEELSVFKMKKMRRRKNKERIAGSDGCRRNWLFASSLGSRWEAVVGGFEFPSSTPRLLHSGRGSLTLLSSGACRLAPSMGMDAVHRQEGFCVSLFIHMHLLQKQALINMNTRVPYDISLSLGYGGMHTPLLTYHTWLRSALLSLLAPVQYRIATRRFLQGVYCSGPKSLALGGLGAGHVEVWATLSHVVPIVTEDEVSTADGMQSLGALSAVMATGSIRTSDMIHTVARDSRVGIHQKLQFQYWVSTHAAVESKSSVHLIFALLRRNSTFLEVRSSVRLSRARGR
ncbi:unnamed protein product [Pleuronectes platessa]|uniref:Sema domain-containing protein n=1 Tax=Pleuronectes platessa TaxID=8262 RepID=A0A9N7YXF3_PLEPL|nr:unnamed protein product [Pleuronectes platessa]